MLYAEALDHPTYYCIHFTDDHGLLSTNSALQRNGIAILNLDAAGIDTNEGLLSNLAKAIRFPSQFGMNWDAADDALRDMSWLPSTGYLLYVYNALHLWRGLPQAAGKLVEAWLFSAEQWASQNVSFHLVFVW